jgi:peptide/nickel transport system ATP-binding protein
MKQQDLEVRALRVTSSLGVIVDGLDLDVAPGETIGIVGESGSGKSLTARALVGLLPAGVEASGSVRLGGRELVGAPERVWKAVRGREIALLLQDPFTMLSPLMRVGPQIELTARNQARGKRDDAIARLDEVGIRGEHVADQYPFQLSGGMRQRVALAAALAGDPKILIADEPSTALDVTTQREILRLIRSTQEKRGMSVILITHDLRIAFSICDRVYVLYAGQLLEIGAAAMLERRPAHPYTSALLAAEPVLDGRTARLAAIPGAVPRPDDVRSQCGFAPRCRWAIDACRAARPPLRELDRGRLTACLRAEDIEPQLLGVAEPRVLEAEVPASNAREAPILETRSLRKTYATRPGGNHALDDVSVVVGRGEKVAIVGESGSGKTTLARCIVGLETPTGGSILLDGTDVSDYDGLARDLRRQARRTAQLVFQDPYSTLNPARSVRFTLEEATRRSSVAEASPPSVAELLELVSLPAQYGPRRPAALSGGERQRVAVARALALRPSLLICDEPVSALDVSVQAQVLNLLLDLNEEIGLALLFITHDLAVVRQVSDRVYVMHDGRVVEAGATAAVLRSPADQYTKRLLESVPRPDPAWLEPTRTKKGD